MKQLRNCLRVWLLVEIRQRFQSDSKEIYVPLSGYSLNLKVTVPKFRDKKED